VSVPNETAILSFSSFCSCRQFDDAWRLDELKPLKEVVLSLDYAQHGLGNGSCGTAITMEKYQLKRVDSYEFAFTLEPLEIW